MSNDPWADFKPDMDVPLPTDTRSSTSYPWDKFQVGASFFFQTDREDDTAKRLKTRPIDSDVCEKTRATLEVYVAREIRRGKRKRSKRCPSMEGRIMTIPTLKLPEDLIQLQAELTIIKADSLRIAERCSRLLETVLSEEGNQTEMFDTGEPTSAYVNQDR